MDINFSQQATIDQARLMQASKALEQAQQAYKNPQDADTKKLKKTAQEFESIFIKQLLDAMDKTVDRTDSILSGGNAEEYFRDMLNGEIANAIALQPGGSGFGLAEAVYKQMAKQEKQTTLKAPEGPQMGHEAPQP